MYAMKIQQVEAIHTPTHRASAPSSRPRGSLRVYDQVERATPQRMVAAEALIAYAAGRRLEDETGEWLPMPTEDGQGWAGRDGPQRVARTEQDAADIRTLIRLGGPLVSQQVVASCRFRLSAHVARIEKAKRVHARAAEFQARRIREHGAPTREMLEWPRPLSGDLSWYGWGVRSGAAYGTVHGAGRGCHAGRQSGFGRQMDTGTYAIRMADPPPLAGEWRRVSEAPAGRSILIVDDHWTDCAQHRSGATQVWAVPASPEAEDQIDNWFALHGAGLRVEGLQHPHEGEGVHFDYEQAGAAYYGVDDSVPSVDAGDAWGVALARIPWLCKDGVVLEGICSLYSSTPMR